MRRSACAYSTAERSFSKKHRCDGAEGLSLALLRQ
jgi:hypothetical protein